MKYRLRLLLLAALPLFLTAGLAAFGGVKTYSFQPDGEEIVAVDGLLRSREP
jgi:hypothetical protein